VYVLTVHIHCPSGLHIATHAHKSENTLSGLADAVQSFLDDEMPRWAFMSGIVKMEVVYVKLPEPEE